MIDVSKAVTRFNEMVEANKAATGIEYITSNEIKGILLECKLKPPSMKAVWNRTKFPNARLSQTKHPNAVRDVVKFMQGREKAALTDDELQLVHEQYPHLNGKAMSGVLTGAKQLLGAANSAEPVIPDVPGMADVKVLLAHYEKARMYAGKCREALDRVQEESRLAELELEKYKPLVRQIEALQALALKLKTGGAA